MRRRIQDLDELVAESRQAKEELRETRDYLQSLITFANAPIVVWAADARITQFNAAFEKMTGYSSDDVVGRELSILFPESSRAASSAEIARSASGEHWESSEIQIRCKDGETRFALWSSANIYSNDRTTLLATIAQGVDITERKRAEQRAEHLSAVLRAVRDVNQLIAKEKDRDRLLQGACASLVETRGYHSAWIALLDDSGAFVTAAEAGLGEELLPLVEQLEHGQLPPCAQRGLRQSEVVAIEDPSSACGGCPLADRYSGRAAMTTRLEHDGRVHGVLTVSAPVTAVGDDEEHGLLHEVAGDIAFAVEAIEVEEERNRAEEDLRQRTHELSERVKELGCLYAVSESFMGLGKPLDEALQGAVELIPSSWRYPDISCARIVLRGQELTSEGFAESDWKQSAELSVFGETAGAVEVFYSEERPEAGEGPFLREERRLIDDLARQIGLLAESRETQEALQESQRYNRTLFEISPIGLVLCRMDGSLVDVNPAYAAIIGRGVEETLALTYWDITPEKYAEDEQAQLESLGTSGRYGPYEKEYIHKDGHLVPVRLSGLILERSGERFIWSSVEDITERKRAEEEILGLNEGLEEKVRERTAELEVASRDLRWQASVLKATNEVLQGALTCDSDADVARTFLAVAEELTGSSFGLVGEVHNAGRLDTTALSDPGWDACRLPDSEKVVLTNDMEIRSYWGRVITEGRSQLVNDPASDPDRVGLPEGHPPIASFLGVPLKQAGTTFGLIALAKKEGSYDPADQHAMESLSVAFVEALQRKRAELALQEAREELLRKERLAVLGQLAGGVGHELRNPLGVISNAVYYLNTVLPDADETVKEYLEIIASEVRSSDRIVSGLLDLSRARPAEKEEITVAALVAEVLERQPPPEGIEVATDIDPTLTPVFVDVQQIGQVLSNLATNAYQAMPEGGRLTIMAERAEDGVRVAIADTGCGISGANMGKLFEPLFTTRARGIGLGLAVSRNLVEVNGGSIEVASEEGKGSTFTVILPAHPM